MGEAQQSIRLMALITCGVLALALPASAGGAADTSAYALSKAQWARIDWQKPEGSPLWKSLSWTTSGDGTVKEATMMLVGAPYRVLWMGGELHLDERDALPSCEDLAPKFAAHFGKPLEDDESIVIPFSETRSMKMVAVFYEWDIGNTRVLARCTGATSSPADPSDPDKLNWSLSFTSPARRPKLTPKFALRCTRTVNYPDGTTHDATDFAIWVNTSLKQVTNADRVVIADNGTVSATDSQITFSVTRNAVKSDYTIDRVTGSLSATVIQDSHAAGTINGKCEKAASLGTKF